jgi:hypothetical protein
MKSSFPETLWTQLIEVIQSAPVDSPQRKQALGELYVLYHGPVLKHIERVFYGACGPHATPDDLTHAFFAHLLEKDGLASVSRAKGRFRAWLKKSAENFCRSYWQRETADKRGRTVTVSLDSNHDVKVEDMVFAEAGRIFDRGYANKLYPMVLDELFAEYCARGQAELFNDLRSFILNDSDNDYRRLGVKHVVEYEAIVTAVSRLRKRVGMKLKHKIAEAMVDPSAAEIEDEVRYLIGLLRDGPEA